MKNLAIIALIFIFIPTNAALAGIAFGDSFADQVIENVENADSVEFKLDASFYFENDKYNESKTLIDATLIGSGENLQTDNRIIKANGRYKGMVNGDISNESGSAVLTTNKAYFKNDSIGQWYFVDYPETLEYKEVVNVIESSDDELSWDMFAITGILPSAEVDGVNMARFRYGINSERVIELLLSTGEFSDEDVAEMQLYYDNNVDFAGEIWINTEDMVPYKLTMHTSREDDESGTHAYASVTILFTSFNKELNIGEPTNAIDFIAERKAGYNDDDNDGLLNYREEKFGTNKNNPDSDGDGYLDGDEVRNGYDPLGPGQLDTDGDGLGDRDERKIWHTSVNRADTDRDGYSDREEILNGYSPLIPSNRDTRKYTEEGIELLADEAISDSDWRRVIDWKELRNGNVWVLTGAVVNESNPCIKNANYCPTESWIVDTDMEVGYLTSAQNNYRASIKVTVEPVQSDYMKINWDVKSGGTTVIDLSYIEYVSIVDGSVRPY
jgi:hypothetical protein